jgi:hypothetical protein
MIDDPILLKTEPSSLLVDLVSYIKPHSRALALAFPPDQPLQ